jgi:hypothetical protein
MAYKRCMVDKQGYMHAHAEICNTLIFLDKKDSRTRLNITLYVHCLAFFPENIS